MVVRSLKKSDADEWQAVRARNHDWLRPWDATVPPGAHPRPSSYKMVVRSLLHQAKQGLCLPFVVEVEGRFVGQVTVSNVSRGSAQWASIGYWLSADVAGRGVAPRAVAMVIDHCFGRWGCTASRSASGPRTPTRCASWRSSASSRSVSPRDSCTSTEPGATTGSSR